VFEALAIAQYLGDRHGVAKGLWPAFDSASRLEAISWTAWTYVTFYPALNRLAAATGARTPELNGEAQAVAARRDTQELLGVLDGRLAKAPWVLGAEFSLADSLMANVVKYGSYCGASLDAHPHVKAWLTKNEARPAFKKQWGG